MHSVLKYKKKTSQANIITVCAWCHRAKYVSEDSHVYWTEHYQVAEGQSISHTICPSCKAKMMEEVNELAFV